MDLIDATVRGHHLLCLLAFESTQQYGEFASAFASMKALYLSPDSTFEVVVGNDDACAACDYYSKEVGCTSPEDGPEARVRSLDEMALGILGMKPGIWKTREIHSRLSTLTPQRTDSVCGHCPWHESGGCSKRLFDAIAGL